MKKIEAIIGPVQLDEVKDSLNEMNIEGMTVLEVQGFGRMGGTAETYRGAESPIDFMPKTPIDVVVADDRAHEVIECIELPVGTGKIADREIVVSTLDEGGRIRSGGGGEAARSLFSFQFSQAKKKRADPVGRTSY